MTLEEVTLPSGKVATFRNDEPVAVEIYNEKFCGLAAKARNEGVGIKRTPLESRTNIKKKRSVKRLDPYSACSHPNKARTLDRESELENSGRE